MNFHTNTPNNENSRSRFFAQILALPFWLRTTGFLASIVLLIVTAAIGLHFLDARFFVSVPEHGGRIAEGIVGRPRDINPVIGKTEADRDLSALLYSGLLRPTGTGLEPDLAQRYTVSADGHTYTVTLRQNATFSDGTPVTADDVVFTVARIQDKGLPTKSPLAPNFLGVTATAQDPHTVVFALDAPHATFPESLTFGILPQHIWKNVGIDEFDQSEYDTEKMVGSGPFVFDHMVRDNGGLVKEYVLKSFPGYVHGEPLVAEFDLYFYGNEEDRITAYKNGEITQIAGAQTNDARDLADNGATVVTASMPRIFGIYFNQSKNSIFADLMVRAALDFAVPREDVTQKVFSGYANAEVGPFPGLVSPIKDPFDKRLLTAQSLLENDGWKRGTDGIYEKTNPKTHQTDRLSFAISLPDIPELTASAAVIQNGWKAMGAEVQLKTFDLGNFTNDIIASRNFEAVFFGQVTGRDPDPFPFWHSSQKDKGMNIAQWSSKAVDDQIATLSKSYDQTDRATILSSINDTIMQQRPAVFAYSPMFVYVVDKNVHGIALPLMTTGADRFANIEQWYVSEERVWKFLAKDSLQG